MARCCKTVLGREGGGRYTVDSPADPWWRGTGRVTPRPPQLPAAHRLPPAAARQRHLAAGAAGREQRRADLPLPLRRLQLLTGEQLSGALAAASWPSLGEAVGHLCCLYSEMPQGRPWGHLDPASWRVLALETLRATVGRCTRGDGEASLPAVPPPRAPVSQTQLSPGTSQGPQGTVLGPASAMGTFSLHR